MMKIRSLKLSAIVLMAGTMLQFGGCVGGIGRQLLDEIVFAWVLTPLLGADPLGLTAAAAG